MIATCTKCGCLYDFRSEESANEPDRMCFTCWNHSQGPAIVVGELGVAPIEGHLPGRPVRADEPWSEE